MMQLLIFIYTMMACWYVNRSHFRGFVAQVTVKACGSLVYTSVRVEKFDCKMDYLWIAIFILSIFPYLKFFKFINTEVKILESCIVFGTEIKYMYSVLLHFQHKNEICGSISAFHCKISCNMFWIVWSEDLLIWLDKLCLSGFWVYHVTCGLTETGCIYYTKHSRLIEVSLFVVHSHCLKYILRIERI